tara:strand:+ start:399 stop:674 length:276 start_codon:yes stop_codon:yes gene_type:complete
MIKPQLYRDAVNRYWRERSLTDDKFYFGLGDRIKDRQESKVPVAGAGTVQFLSIANTITKGLGFVFPPARKLATLTEYAEKTAREKSGILD